MVETIQVPPALSAEEWELIIGLLEHERTELPAEIRRSGSSEMRDQLRQREALVDHLLERLRNARIA